MSHFWQIKRWMVLEAIFISCFDPRCIILNISFCALFKYIHISGKICRILRLEPRLHRFPRRQFFQHLYARDIAMLSSNEIFGRLLKFLYFLSTDIIEPSFDSFHTSIILDKSSSVRERLICSGLVKVNLFCTRAASYEVL